MPRTRLFLMAFVLLAALVPGLRSADDPGSDDELLSKHKIGTDSAALLRYFARRTLTDTDRKQIESWIRQLGSESFSAREEATAKLTEAGASAVPFLKQAAKDPDEDIARRAQRSLKDIDAGPGSALTAAAIRRLVRHQPKEALQALLDFFPFAEDDWVEDEALAGIGTLGVRAGQVDPLLSAAVKDALPARRAAAAFVLARAGGQAQRAVVRQLLDDRDEKVKLYAARGLLPGRFLQGDDELAADQSLLKDAKVGADAAALLAFFQSRTLRDADRRQLEQWIAQLGSEQFKEREEASGHLVQRGPPALPFLKEACQSGDLEVARRAEACIAAIQRGPGPALPIAAARMLARRHPAEAIATLLAYLPFADDESVQDEVLSALCLLSVQQAGIDPELVRALKDPLPIRRQAAAHVLGQVGAREHCQAAALLLDDRDPRVRFGAAQGLLAAKDKSAVPVLLALLADGPEELLWRVEELLQRLAGERAPAQTLTETTAPARQKHRDAWAGWWREQGERVDLSRLEHGPRQLGLSVIAELDSNRIWECGRDGAPRWQLQNLLGPIDAQVLPGGRVLIAEHQGQKVTERDLQGKILWEKAVPGGNPIVCQRLPNGNTFIATYNKVLEVRKDGSEVYAHTPNIAPGFPAIYGAQKLRNGNIVCISGGGALLEMDAAGKTIRTLQVGNNGGWCSVEGLPGGRYLITLTNLGKVKEIDSTGRTLWECSVAGAAHATRLPNGNTLVASMMNRRVVEVDAKGTEVWKQTTVGRPFHVHRR